MLSQHSTKIWFTIKFSNSIVILFSGPFLHFSFLDHFINQGKRSV